MWSCPGWVASGEETGTAADAWEHRGYFPFSAEELRLGYFLFSGRLTCSLSSLPPPLFPDFRSPPGEHSFLHPWAPAPALGFSMFLMRTLKWQMLATLEMCRGQRPRNLAIDMVALGTALASEPRPCQGLPGSLPLLLAVLHPTGPQSQDASPRSQQLSRLAFPGLCHPLPLWCLCRGCLECHPPPSSIPCGRLKSLSSHFPHDSRLDAPILVLTIVTFFSICAAPQPG